MELGHAGYKTCSCRSILIALTSIVGEELAWTPTLLG
jgi:hypothetical protein